MIQIKAFVVNYFSENTYVVSDETKEAVLIDCGCLHREEQLELQEYVRENDLKLVHYICTHLHLDHTFGNEFVYNTYGLRPEASVADVRTIPLANELKAGDVVRFGHSELKVLALPGHTPGGLAFYNEKEGFVMVGDSLFAGSVGRTDLWGGSSEALVTSIRANLMTLPDDTVVYPGHGPTTTIEVERTNNPYI